MNLKIQRQGDGEILSVFVVMPGLIRTRPIHCECYIFSWMELLTGIRVFVLGESGFDIETHVLRLVGPTKGGRGLSAFRLRCGRA